MTGSEIGLPERRRCLQMKWKCGSLEVCIATRLEWHGVESCLVYRYLRAGRTTCVNVMVSHDGANASRMMFWVLRRQPSPPQRLINDT